MDSWIIGIFTGVISGIIVYYITSKILERGRGNAYKSKIKAANKAILDMLKPYIANLGIPNETILNSAIASISRQFEIPRSDMANINELYEDLICEFISNPYIPKDTKTKNLEELILKVQQTKPKAIDKKAIPEKSRQAFDVVSAIVSVLSFLTIACSYPVLISTFFKSKYVDYGILSQLVISLVSIVTVVAVVSLLVIQINKAKGKHEKRRHEEYLFSSSENTMKMSNHGTSLFDVYDEPMAFIDYFDRLDGNEK